MSSLCVLTDRETETINGGGSRWKMPSMTLTTRKSVTTNVNQLNSAVNYTSSLFGVGLISNEQVNAASITTVVG